MSEDKERAAMAPCGECGMLCDPTEFHPFAACLMFKACHNGGLVRDSLEFVRRASLAQQAGEDARDGARYRHIRSLPWDRDMEAYNVRGEHLDAAIDQAMKGGEG